jgi:hypothetical protein
MLQPSAKPGVGKNPSPFWPHFWQSWAGLMELWCTFEKIGGTFRIVTFFIYGKLFKPS